MVHEIALRDLTEVKMHRAMTSRSRRHTRSQPGEPRWVGAGIPVEMNGDSERDANGSPGRSRTDLGGLLEADIRGTNRNGRAA